jgi:hypothetical protein
VSDQFGARDFSLNVVSDHGSMASGIHRDIAFALADEVDD